MNKEINFNEIYNDFFGKDSYIKEKKTSSSSNQINYNEEIEKLYITPTSKKLLTKIINYILNYKENTSIYVNFNIKLIIKNQETINSILNIIENASKTNNYVTGTLTKNISFYKINDISSLEESYNNYGIYIYKDLEALNIHDDNFKKKILHFILEHLNNKKINIIISTEDNISNLFNNDIEKEQNSFNFTIIGNSPTPNEILNDITNKITVKDKVKLLEYIENTFEKSNLDYPQYRDNLCKYISFNNKIPKLDTPKTTEEIFKELESLVGLTNVKKTMYDFVNLITLKNKTKEELQIEEINLHMLFLGNPGTGKTTVARMLSNILYNLNLIRQNKLIEVSQKDLVAEYVGQTAPKTMEVINKAKGGILFIDEAYTLKADSNNTYNAEAIATLIKAMEDYRNDLVVIFAGYTKEMDDFIKSNSGISSRIGYTFIFEDYTNRELKQIFTNMMKKSGFIVTEESLIKLEEIINEQRTKENFGNARLIRNIYEKTIVNHASNTKTITNKTILKTITDSDIKY